MKQCTKCAIRVDGDAKICRRCGSILAEIDMDDAALGSVSLPASVSQDGALQGGISQDNAIEGAAAENSAAADVSPVADSRAIDGPATSDPAADERLVPPLPDPNAMPDPIDQFVARTFEWQCRGCGETIERQFDTCWKCGTTRDGSILPDFTRETPDDEPNDTDADATLIDEGEADVDETPAGANSTHERHDCLRCGSDQVITGVNVVSFASGELAAGRLELMALEDHERLLFMGRQARLTADVCAQCGHVELRAENIRGLPQRRRKHW